MTTIIYSWELIWRDKKVVVKIRTSFQFNQKEVHFAYIGFYPLFSPLFFIPGRSLRFRDRATGIGKGIQQQKYQLLVLYFIIFYSYKQYHKNYSLRIYKLLEIIEIHSRISCCSNKLNLPNLHWTYSRYKNDIISVSLLYCAYTML